MRRARYWGPVKKTFLIGIVWLGTWMPNAHAVDWKINSSLSESVDISDNRKMAINPPGTSYSSVSSLMFDARALTPSSLFALVGNLNYRAYGGPAK